VKGKTKQATLISDFHAHESIQLFQHNPAFPRFEDQSHTEAGLNNRGVPLHLLARQLIMSEDCEEKYGR